MADWYQAAKDADSSIPKKEAEINNTPSLNFASRRSPVISKHGMVATSQPLASAIGLRMLQEHNANAAEAAIAIAAALCVTEPCSTGLGGDMFCLYYDNATKQVSCINGSGCSPARLTMDAVQKYCDDSNYDKFMFSPLAVTVPGAARGYEDLLNKHGSGNLTMSQLLQPAIELAEEGFPVTPVTSFHWNNGVQNQIKPWHNTLYGNTAPSTPMPFTVPSTQQAPRAGQLFQNYDLAQTLREFGELGATRGFYEGRTGTAIVDTLQKLGGVMTMEDLANHTASTFPEPISVQYRDKQFWQIPPNGQGIAACIALSGYQALEDANLVDNTNAAHSIHAQMEMMRLGFADVRQYVADDRYMKDVNTDWLLDKSRISKRAIAVMNGNSPTNGAPLPSSDTVSFQVVDKDGNAISFVNSNFMGFGTGIVPTNCGFALQNRGFGFTLHEHHPNALGPSKRPYHTIIPGMMTNAATKDLYCTFSNMGGHMQPQGHLQLAIHLVANKMNPQEAIDAPRFCIADGTQNGKMYIEEGTPYFEELQKLGHSDLTIVGGHDRAMMGRAQIIVKDNENGVLWGGSDGRADGCAMGY